MELKTEIIRNMMLQRIADLTIKQSEKNRCAERQDIKLTLR